MRAFFTIFFTLFLAFSFGFGSETKEKIKSTTKSLQTSSSKEKAINKKLDELGKEIIKNSNELKAVSKKIDDITGVVINLSQTHKDEVKTLESLKSESESLTATKERLEESMASIIASEFSFDLIETSDIITTNSIINSEIFRVLSEVLKSDFEDIAKDYSKTIGLINSHGAQISDLEKSLKDYNAKKDELSKEKKKYESLVANLNKDRDRYLTQLEKIQKENEALAKTLEELKIIDDKEEKEKARKAEEARVAKLEKEKKDSDKSQKDSEIIAKKDEPQTTQSRRVEDIDRKVKLHGSSYKASRVKKYSGKKTISPLKSASVKRKFGNYTDPVYGIKIFNESVVLSSKSKNAQVFNVLDGKVVFAKETAVLDKVVIVENKDGIHTIYAHLDQIAPTIRVGSVIKKGYVLGKVEEDLTFEVTQQNYHIDPLEMILLK